MVTLPPHDGPVNGRRCCGTVALLVTLWLTAGPILSEAQAQPYPGGGTATARSRVNHYPLNSSIIMGGTRGVRGTSVFFGPPAGGTPLAPETSGLGDRWYRPRGPDVVTRMYREAEDKGPLGLKPRRTGRILPRTLYTSKAAPARSESESGQEPGRDKAGGVLGGPATRPAPAVASFEGTSDVVARKALAARRMAYVNAGWEFFRQEMFREACESFAMADAIVFNDPSQRETALKERAEVKLGLVYAAVAAGRYAEAVNALAWLLKPDKTTGELPDPLFLARVRNIREQYQRPALFDTHVSAVEFHVATEKQAVPLMALRAFVWWSDTVNPQSRMNAKFEARRLTDPSVPAPWGGLHAAMLRAEAAGGGQDGSEANASGAAWRAEDVRLPWEKVAGESPATRPVSPGR